MPPIDTDDVATNPSSNLEFAQIAQAQLSRRTVLGGSLGAAALVAFLGGPPAHAGGLVEALPTHAGRGRRLPLRFEPLPPSDADSFVVPKGYTAQVLIPWGTPLLSSGPAWRKDASNSAADQEIQVGAHHDGMAFYPTDSSYRRSSSDSARHGLLALNHEYCDPVLMTPDGIETVTAEKVRKAQAAHGVTVIALAQAKDGSWTHVDSAFNRRVHVNTPVAFSGPVSARHPQLRAKTAPRGTLNNCSSGATPWGTYLTCEENWHQYFASTDASRAVTVEEKRYGVKNEDEGFGWYKADSRFDLAKDPLEQNRWGWIVEIDPFDPKATPVKRAALGRYKHENACVTESRRGQAVVYSGDDQDKEYIYKFVSADSWRSSRRRGRSPLDRGVLYVAKFHEDGTGQWLPLVFGQGPLTAENGWKDQADVLIRTRTAADALGATKMDRPEWIREHPKTGELYCTLTNGSAGPNAMNPRNPNPYGHIIRWSEHRGDKAATRFTWDIFVLAGDPAYDNAVTINGDIFGSPDGLAFDQWGRLWIQTDISNSSQNLAEKGYDNIKNNAVLVADPVTREIRRFATGPRGCEITGIFFAPDHRTVFVNVQHPGEDTKAWGSPTPANPRAVSNWPDYDPAGRPRSAMVAIRRTDGGLIAM